MGTNSAIRTISAMLVLLFTYTAMSKLLDLETFRGQMLNQPLPEALGRQLVWAIPLAELLTVALLVTRRSRLIGLCCASVLMAGFTLYVALVLSHAFDRVPCSCGGIMASLSWEGHLAVNALFLAMALTGAILEKRGKPGPIKPVS